ncbi:hypothetical protein EIN_087840 [Entamoeba invadens IP1]|uniref:hypothetical protein n=1 Tax=Entamoeba invadens IP1 TaxID=370355 RepID=UPI0002C3F446|nr:hypothetical protein EIN_087840 [Entamoeba invadens IP1]ELP85452.1 hypothetical protein EIN_087840 [Entamoeba invadens IP1]|eukprot:XP_004184798.1 hypothetical protein EIN_087840 [Entamoeba invadens IP1]
MLCPIYGTFTFNSEQEKRQFEKTNECCIDTTVDQHNKYLMCQCEQQFVPSTQMFELCNTCTIDSEENEYHSIVSSIVCSFLVLGLSFLAVVTVSISSVLVKVLNIEIPTQRGYLQLVEV